jgi:HSP20 family molecular chaperone IbpA
VFIQALVLIITSLEAFPSTTQEKQMFGITTYNPLSPLYNSAMWFDTTDTNAIETTNSDSSDQNGTRGERTRRRRATAQTSRNERGYSITVEMPGVTRNNVEVKVSGGYLTVVGKRSLNENETLSYFSNWAVSDNISVDGITARCEAGLLELFVPTLTPKSLTISVD